jgi:pyruvate kinase
VELVRSVTSTPICLDTQGAQVRCGFAEEGLILAPERSIILTAEPVMGTAGQLTLWPDTVFGTLKKGTVVGIDFDGVQLQVDEVGDGEATATVVRGGKVRSNKAVTLEPMPELPALSDRDRDAIEEGARLGIMHYALSFASHARDVELIRGLAPDGSHIMSKIESRSGVRDMDGIIEASDSILIDRGDLSHEVPFEHVPYYQKAIARRANRWNRPAYVATNLLESMVTSSMPTIAEANDIANTLLDGVHGLVLAAETAVGLDPLGSVDLVLRAIAAFERASQGQLLEMDRPSLGLVS